MRAAVRSTLPRSKENPSPFRSILPIYRPRGGDMGRRYFICTTTDRPRSLLCRRAPIATYCFGKLLGVATIHFFSAPAGSSHDCLDITIAAAVKGFERPMTIPLLERAGSGERDKTDSPGLFRLGLIDALGARTSQPVSLASAWGNPPSPV
jgi:hypothetical protein